MRPEDIDKIFKERLGNTSPMPPADLWNRLQDRMEAELPHQIKPVKEEERRSFMWIYSSVAATLSLLLTVGVVFYNIKSTPEVSDALVQQEKPVLHETPIAGTPDVETIAQAEVKTEKISEPQATEDATPASKITETVDKPATIAKATTKAVQQSKTARVMVAEVKPKADVQQAIASNTPTAEKPAAIETEASIAKPIASAAMAASADLNAKPVEIIIKRAATPATATEEAADESGLEKKARLAKNIFKQARNLANGEQVELAALGIKADRVALETQIGKQKISKVINL